MTGHDTTASPDNKTQDNQFDCRVQKLHGTHLVECLMNKATCRWMLYFGDGRYCTHPVAKQAG